MSLNYEKLATMIIDRFQPTSVMDIGCGEGFLIKALRDKDIMAWGIDTSEQAISEAPEEVADFLFHYDITSRKELTFPVCDLIVSFNTLERIPESKLVDAIVTIKRLGSRFYIRVGTQGEINWPLDIWQTAWPDAVFEESN